eukprot:gene7397-1322_t
MVSPLTHAFTSRPQLHDDACDSRLVQEFCMCPDQVTVDLPSSTIGIVMPPEDDAERMYILDSGGHVYTLSRSSALASVPHPAGPPVAPLSPTPSSPNRTSPPSYNGSQGGSQTRTMAPDPAKQIYLQPDLGIMYKREPALFLSVSDQQFVNMFACSSVRGTHARVGTDAVGLLPLLNVSAGDRLLGLALHPDNPSFAFSLVILVQPDQSTLYRVTRHHHKSDTHTLILEEHFAAAPAAMQNLTNNATYRHVPLSAFGGASLRQGGAFVFDHSGALVIGFGDNGAPDASQDISTMQGK